jgi:hypothetical protein
MDMWEPYLQAMRAQVPEVAEKIVFDSFHSMVQIGKAVDMVHKQEHRTLMESGDETLKGSTYVWLYSRENVPEREEFACADAQGNSRLAGHEPLKRRCAVSGSMSIWRQAGSFGSGGTSEPRTDGWSRFVRQTRPFASISTTSYPTINIPSPTR